jgi:hypothetical protein
MSSSSLSIISLGIKKHSISRTIEPNLVSLEIERSRPRHRDANGKAVMSAIEREEFDRESEVESKRTFKLKSVGEHGLFELRVDTTSGFPIEKLRRAGHRAL